MDNLLIDAMNEIKENTNIDATKAPKLVELIALKNLKIKNLTNQLNK